MIILLAKKKKKEIDPVVKGLSNIRVNDSVCLFCHTDPPETWFPSKSLSFNSSWKLFLFLLAGLLLKSRFEL
jgi:hypothetical protein